MSHALKCLSDFFVLIQKNKMKRNYLSEAKNLHLSHDYYFLWHLISFVKEKNKFFLSMFFQWFARLPRHFSDTKFEVVTQVWLNVNNKWLKYLVVKGKYYTILFTLIYWSGWGWGDLKPLFLALSYSHHLF